MGLTRRAAKQFSNALYIKLEVPDRSMDPITGRTCVHMKIPGGPSFPVKLSVVDDFGNRASSKADAGLLLRGPGSLAVFIGRSSHIPVQKRPWDKDEVMTFAILDTRVIEEKTGALAGSLGALEITTVEGVLKEFSDAIKHVSDRELKDGALWQ